jgi:hypothetical protein
MAERRAVAGCLKETSVLMILLFHKHFAGVLHGGSRKLGNIFFTLSVFLQSRGTFPNYLGHRQYP